jgi:hypothetical protein
VLNHLALPVTQSVTAAPTASAVVAMSTAVGLKQFQTLNPRPE